MTKSPITKFLLADDDTDDAELLYEAVSEFVPNAQFASVENGEEVFNLLTGREAQLPDVIFLDINMPVMDGWECLKKLKAHIAYSNIPVIIYSTSSAEKDVSRAYALGAFTFLRKPDNFKDLVNVVEVLAKTPHELILNQLSGFECVKLQHN